MLKLEAASFLLEHFLSDHLPSFLPFLHSSSFLKCCTLSFCSILPEYFASVRSSPLFPYLLCWLFPPVLPFFSPFFAIPSFLITLLFFPPFFPPSYFSSLQNNLLFFGSLLPEYSAFFVLHWNTLRSALPPSLTGLMTSFLFFLLCSVLFLALNLFCPLDLYWHFSHHPLSSHFPSFLSQMLMAWAEVKSPSTWMTPMKGSPLERPTAASRAQADRQGVAEGGPACKRAPRRAAQVARTGKRRGIFQLRDIKSWSTHRELSLPHLPSHWTPSNWPPWRRRRAWAGPAAWARAWVESRRKVEQTEGSVLGEEQEERIAFPASVWKRNIWCGLTEGKTCCPLEPHLPSSLAHPASTCRSYRRCSSHTRIKIISSASHFSPSIFLKKKQNPDWGGFVSLSFSLFLFLWVIYPFYANQNWHE